MSDSVAKAGRDLHVGDKHIHEAADPSKRRSATQTGVPCPICHQIVVGADHFACPKCKRTHLHIKHQDKETYLCSECTATLAKARGTIEVGDTFAAGRYVVRQMLGQGGMGQVFLVTDNEWYRDFAFKFLPSELSSDQTAIQSLRKEAGLMAQLTHDCLARLFDIGSDGNRHYLKMEYIDGKTLDDIIREHPHRRLSLEEAFHYIKGIVEGLQYLHDNNVVHRDLKPGNIMIKEDGTVKILDFGIAQTIKDTMTRVTNMPSTGTLMYMSPEQLQGRRLSPRSDIYSLGIIVYELLTGKPPFHTGPIFEQHLSVEPEPIKGIADATNTSIMRSLAKRENDRYDSCSAFCKQLIQSQNSHVEARHETKNSIIGSVKTHAPEKLSGAGVEHSPSIEVTVAATLRGHDSSVNSVAFSSDGLLLATGSDDRTIKLWDVSTQRVKTTLEGHNDRVPTVVFSPDGQLLASGSVDRSIKLWDVSKQKEVKTLKGHEGHIFAIAFSPDGELVASGSLDDTIKVWNVVTQNGPVTLEGHSDWVTSITFSSDGQLLVSGSNDNTIKLWDIAIWKMMATLNGHRGWVVSVALSPDGEILASGSMDSTVILWDVETQKEIVTLCGHRDSVESVIFSPDGQLLASGSQDEIKLWDVIQQKEIRTIRGHRDSIYSVAFSPDGKTLASGSRDSTIKLWKLEYAVRNK